MRRRKLLSGLMLLSLVAAAPVVAGDRWLHVRVDEDGRHGDKVDINIPMGVVGSVLPHIAVDPLQHGKLRLDVEQIEGIDLREVLAALRDSPDTDFVTVQSEKESVRVAKENGYLVVRVEDRGKGSVERVRVTVPLEVVEALVGGDPDELDLMAALEALEKFEGQDLVHVESDDTTVRVWIDSSESGI